MAYNRNIPQPTDLISNSQPSILGNFQTIDSGTTQTGTGFSRNHVTMTDGTNGGLHNRIDFYQNIVAPTVTGFVGALYPVSISAASELQYTNSGGSTQITSGSNAIWKGGTGTGVITTTVAQSGQLNFPNGVQMRWGKINGVTNAQVCNFGFAFSNNCFTIQIGGQRSNNDIRSLWVGSQPSTTQFTVYTSIGGVDIWYFAIGN